MNDIDKILEKINEEAQMEATKVLAKAKADADSILVNYAAAADKEKAALLEAAEKRAAQQKARMISVAELEGRKKLLSAKQDLIGQVFDMALDSLLSLPEGEYSKLLASLAARYAQTGTEEVILSAKDKNKFGTAVVAAANQLLKTPSRKLTLSGETRKIAGGVILKQGDIEINCALETQVRMMREELALDIAQVLFS